MRACPENIKTNKQQQQKKLLRINNKKTSNL